MKGISKICYDGTLRYLTLMLLVLLFSANTVFTVEAATKMFPGAKKMAFSELSKQKNLLVVTLDQSKKAETAESTNGRRIQIVVDGILMEMDEEMVKGLIRNGIFIVVWAGTSVPIGEHCKLFPELCIP